ncbi:HD domain-containing metal-dependent phosphohydrolase family protein [Perilla frutescens var. hirtella]|nr:HD domain-containing metal-dependent phosphohydrolase family protein [Perilla frutescens var. hirtella]
MITASEKDASKNDIVADGRNGIDVDKFDYIVRDSRACGLGCNFEFQRILETMRVIEDEICYLSSYHPQVVCCSIISCYSVTSVEADNLMSSAYPALHLHEDDIAVSNVRIDLTRGKNNPLDSPSMYTAAEVRSSIYMCLSLALTLLLLNSEFLFSNWMPPQV